MKSLFIALTIVASSLVASTSHAGEIKVTPQVLKSFESTFENAKEVDWSETALLYKVRFEFSGQYVTAYYEKEGTLIAITRNITVTQLPVILQVDLKTDYENYWITDLFEVSNDSGIEYYITLENADNKVILKGNNVTKWNLYQKGTKS
jgi:hypothetical protein